MVSIIYNHFKNEDLKIKYKALSKESINVRFSIEYNIGYSINFNDDLSLSERLNTYAKIF